MDQATGRVRSGRIHALAVDGSAIEMPVDAVQAVTPDPESPLRTRLHLDDAVVLVRGSFETWMSALSERWTNSLSPP